MTRFFFAPWDQTIRLPAAPLEMHCARCRALELPYTASPSAVGTALAAVSPERQAAIAQSAEAAARAIPAMFEWAPDDYSPSSSDPLEKLASDAWDHFALFGGRGSAKSHGAAEGIIKLASERKERVAGAREYMQRIKESSKELLETKIKASPWATDWEVLETELRNKRTGSVIFFIGLNGQNAESVGKSLEGVTILWADEAQLLTQRSLDIILPTIRAAGSRCIWTWNPGEDPSPVDQLFRGERPPERSLVQCRLIEDNPYLYTTRLASEMRSSFRRDKQDKFRHIWRGAHLEITDATVFPNVISAYLTWDRLDVRLGDNVHELSGMDFGYGGPDPSAAITCYLILPSARPDGGLRPILYVAREAVQPNVPNHELHRLTTKVRAKRVLCDSANPLMISALNASGTVAAYPAVKGPGSLVAGIRKLQSCDIVVSPECPETLTEMQGLRWATDPKTNKVRKPLVTVGEDHTIAAIRYALSEHEVSELENGGVIHV